MLDDGVVGVVGVEQTVALGSLYATGGAHE